MALQIFIKKNVKGEFGSPPEDRPLEDTLNYGIINLDKPKGPTSHQISDYVKKILNINKAGHSGTLDPQVTGVQPIALGRATRIAQFLLTAPKEYVGVMHIHNDADENQLREVFAKFIGKIKQLPPIKSAVKRQERVREIYDFGILEIDGKDVLFKVRCEAGTYVRKLCHDLGKALGTGAHMAELRRIKAGPFTEEDNLITLQDLADACYYYTEEGNQNFLHHCIQPIEKAVSHLPKCWILDTTIISLTHGRDLAIPGISKLENFKKGEIVAIMTLKGELVALGESVMSAVEINTKEKGLAVAIKKVFMAIPQPSLQTQG